MPSFAARHYCNAAVSSAARQDVGGRACRSVNGVIDSRRKAIAPAARGRPVEFTPTSALDQSGLLVQRRPPGADATLARFRQNVVPQLDDAYNFARFLSRDADAAEYIVQEAFLRAYRTFAGYRGGDARAWIFTIVRNCYHSWLMDRRGKSRVEVDYDGEGSHVGFHLPSNPNALGTLEEAIAKVQAMPKKPASMIHTGDISHLSLESQFDAADRIISQARLDAHYVPGEHDFLDPDRKFYVDCYGRGTKGAGWYSFDANGVHFIGLVNVFNLKGGGMGGADQLEWLEDDLKGRSASTPVVVFAHIPLRTIYPEWGWGTDDSAQALSYLKPFGSATVLNGHIHQIMQKVEGNVTFHTARSTTFPQPASGTALSPGPIKDFPADKPRAVLGIADVAFKQNEQRIAIIDTPLQA